MPSILTPKANGPTVSKPKNLTFWKQIAPNRAVHYIDPVTKQRCMLDMGDPTYHEDLKTAFHNRLGPDSVAFQLAQSDNNHGRDWDPEKARGVVTDLRTFEELPPKIQAKIQASVEEGRTLDPRGSYVHVRMFNEEAAQAVLNNKDLAVSARIREGYIRSDNQYVPRAVIHVCGTYDSQIEGMSPWTEADLTRYPGEDGAVLDLSNTTYQEAEAVAKKNKGKNGQANGGPAAVVDDDLDLSAFTDEELADLATDLDAELEDFETDETDETNEDSTPQLVGAGSGQADLSTVAYRAAQAASQRADEALRQLAEGQWLVERDQMLNAGVPEAAIDLTQRYLAAPGGFTVDLSNIDGTTNAADVAGDFRKLLGLLSGYVDLANEQGHSGGFNKDDDADPDASMLKAWDAQFPG